MVASFIFVSPKNGSGSWELAPPVFISLFAAVSGLAFMPHDEPINEKRSLQGEPVTRQRPRAKELAPPISLTCSVPVRLRRRIAPCAAALLLTGSPTAVGVSRGAERAA